MGLNLWSVLKKASGSVGKKGPKSLVDEFYYPQFGTGRIYEEIGRSTCRRSGTEIHTSAASRSPSGTTASAITEGRRRGAGRACRRCGRRTVVESVPLTRSSTCSIRRRRARCSRPRAGLRWRAQVYLFLTLDKEQVTPDNWIYFPNKDIPFGRTSEMKNFSKDMCPEGKTSFFIEFFTFEGDEIWNMSKEQLLDLVMPYFEKWGFFTRDEIRGRRYLMKRPHVYPVYDTSYKGNVDDPRTWLDASRT